MNADRVRTSRALGTTLFLGMLGALGLTGAGYLAVVVVPEASGAWLGVVVLGALGLVCAIGAAVAKRYDAACPGCGAPLALDGPEDARTVCRACTTLIEVQGGQVRSLPVDTIAPTPDFGVIVLPRMKVPAVCAACGAPATRAVPFVAKDSALGTSALTLVGGLLSGSLALAWSSGKASGGVPYCAEHDGGHEVVPNDGTFLLWVRSFRFLDALKRENPQMLFSFYGERPKKPKKA